MGAYNPVVPGGRAVALEPVGLREESPGTTEQDAGLIASGGDPRESATENIPPPLRW